VRKKAKEVRFLKGSCNNFVPPACERAGFIERAKASWNEDTKNWDIRHIRITHLNEDMAKIARSLENDELMPAPVICSTPHLFDALYYCGAFGQTGERHGSAEKGWEGYKDYREAANMAGQAVDKNGMVVLCADGNALTEHSGLDRAQQKILKMTKKPDQEAPPEPGPLETLFSELSNAGAASSAPATPQQTNTPRWNPPRRKEEKRYADQNPTTAALREWIDAKEHYGARSEQAWSAEKRYNYLMQRDASMPQNSAAARKIDSMSSNMLLFGAAALTALALVVLSSGSGLNHENSMNQYQENSLPDPAGIGHMEIDADANVNIKNKYDNMRLISAAEDGTVDTVRLLLEKRADINAKDKDGNTALMLAAIYRNPEIVHLLLEKGADVNAENKYGSTALMLAEKFGHVSIIYLLKGSKSSEKLVLHGSYPVPRNDKSASLAHSYTEPFQEKSKTSEDKTAPFLRTFTVTGDSCEIRGDVINVSAGEDASTYPLSKGCALMPR